MPADIPELLKAHFGEDVTTLAICWLVERSDGQILRYTSHDKSLEIEEYIYEPADAGDVSALEQTSDGSSNNMDINMAFSGQGITREDIAKGRFNQALMKVFIVNYKDISMGMMKLVCGNMGEIDLDEFGGKFELKGLSERLQNKIGRAYSYRCDVEKLGGDRCLLDLTLFTFTGSVTEVEDQMIFTDTSRAEEDKYFNYGTIEFTSGLNEGWTKEVKAFAASEITLFEPMPYEIEAGDTYTIIAGCDRYPATCREKFDNYINCQGFEYLPGRDELIKYPDAQ
ncbi:MAG: DUF2163 domain-containing protein [Desulfobacteraceae bacterium]|nr:DUF2163 domain-containing protein [Desulfobacteraceae bacterium]